MLKALEKIPESRIQGVLAELALSLTPNPGIERATTLSAEDMSLEQVILAEIRERRNLSKDDDSPRARNKIQRELSQAMRHATLDEQRLPIILARMGQQGELWPHQYEIKQTDSYRRHAKEFRVSWRVTKDTILKPFSVVHLLPDEFDQEQSKAFSLYYKGPFSEGDSDKFFILAMTERSGYVQSILWVWRIYPEDIGIPANLSSVDVLKEFCNYYGLEISVGNDKEKFILYKSFDMSLLDPNEDLKFLTVINKPRAGTVHCFFRENREKDVFEVAFAFAIDHQKYKADLAKHKIGSK